MPTSTASREERLIDALKRGFPDWKATTLKQRLKNGLVMVNGAAVVSGATMIASGDKLEILAKPLSPASFFPAKLGPPPLDVIYADDAILAIDKPSGLLSVASERERDVTAVRIMRGWLEEQEGEIHAAHRLDRDASGVLLFARGLEYKRILAANWHRFGKTYLAMVDGTPPEKEGTITKPLWEDKRLFVRVAEKGGGEAAVTHYRLIRSNGARSLLEVDIETGRKHQIRVHLASVGCPIVGDVRYGVSKASRLALHAHRLTIFHPVDGREIVITAKTPPLFSQWLRHIPASFRSRRA
jgi:Pseudouridylate synthases, 23S RNA-specific